MKLRGAISEASSTSYDSVSNFWNSLNMEASFRNTYKHLAAAAQGQDNSVNAKAREFFVKNYIPVAVVGGFFVVVFPILVYMYYRYQARMREKTEEQRRKLHVSNSKLSKRINDAKKGKSKTPYGSPGSDSEGGMSPGSPSSDDNASDSDTNSRRGKGNDLENGSVSSKVSRQKASIKKIDAEISKINYMGINREEADDIKAEQPEHQLFLDFLSVLVTSDVQKAIKNLAKFNGTLRGKLSLPARSLPAKLVDLMDKSEREVSSKNMSEMRKYAYELFVENEDLRKKTAMVGSPSGPKSVTSQNLQQSRAASPPYASADNRAPLISQKVGALPSKSATNVLSSRGANDPALSSSNNYNNRISQQPNISANTQEPYEPYSPAEQRMPSPSASRAISPNVAAKQIPSLSLQKMNISASGTTTTTPGASARLSSSGGNLQSIISKSVSTTPASGATRPSVIGVGSLKIGGNSNTTPNLNNLRGPSAEKAIPSLKLTQSSTYTDTSKPLATSTPGIRTLMASQSTRVLSPPLASAQANQTVPGLVRTESLRATPLAISSSNSPGDSNIRRNSLSITPGNGSLRQSASPPAASSSRPLSIGLTSRAPTLNASTSSEAAYVNSNQIGVSNEMAYRSNPLAKGRSNSATKVDGGKSPAEQQLASPANNGVRSISSSRVNIMSKGGY